MQYCRISKGCTMSVIVSYANLYQYRQAQTVSLSQPSGRQTAADDDPQARGRASDVTYSPGVAELAGAASKRTHAANNILSFISARLQQDMAEGADAEALRSRLEAGLEGFLEGYQQAYDQLSALGQLVPGVKQAVEKTYSDVLSGIDELAKQLGIDSPVTDEMRSPVDKVAETSRASVSTFESKSFDFSVTTQDGDRVSISVQASHSSGLQFSQVQSYSGQNTVLGLGLSASFHDSGQFFLSVDGELDEGELEAIGDLLNQIQGLAEDFYAGDLEQAYKEALELGFDRKELSQFSVQLRMEQSVSVQETYGVQTKNEPAQAVERNFSALEHFMSVLEKMRERALDLGLKRIEDILGAPALQGDKFQASVEAMKDMLAMLNSDDDE
jgi:flagellar biosynthesis/type III secretory pathway protein FliH